MNIMASITRRAARECAVKALYSFEFNKDADPVLWFATVCNEGEIPTNDFAASLFMGVAENKEAIDAKIAENAKGWKLERIAKMSLSIMRLCVYELMYTEVPKPIAINEAIELAKAYDTDDAPAFINGVLNAVAKTLDSKD
jgi:N utilization substance protein B